MGCTGRSCSSPPGRNPASVGEMVRYGPGTHSKANENEQKTPRQGVPGDEGLESSGTPSDVYDLKRGPSGSLRSILVPGNGTESRDGSWNYRPNIGRHGTPCDQQKIGRHHELVRSTSWKNTPIRAFAPQRGWFRLFLSLARRAVMGSKTLQRAQSFRRLRNGKKREHKGNTKTSRGREQPIPADLVPIIQTEETHTNRYTHKCTFGLTILLMFEWSSNPIPSNNLSIRSSNSRVPAMVVR